MALTDETLADLALSRSALDRVAHERRRPEILTELLDDPRTRVAEVRGDRMRVAPSPTAATAATAPPATAFASSRCRAPEAADHAGLALHLGRDADGTAYVGVVTREVGSGPADGASRPGGRWVAHPAAGRGGPRRPRRRGVHDRPGAGELARHPPLLPALRRAHGPTQAGWVRRCEREGSEHYPRTDPAVIMSVVDPDDRLLLGRGRTGRGPVLGARRLRRAGGVVRGRGAREVAEEVGVTVDGARYLGNQPWPFPSSVMIGFAATTRETELTIDPVEMAEARWVTRDEYRDLLLQRHDPHPEWHLDRQADHRALAGPDGRVRAAARTCGRVLSREGFVSRRGGNAPPRATGWSRPTRRGRRPSGRCGCRR